MFFFLNNFLRWIQAINRKKICCKLLEKCLLSFRNLNQKPLTKKKKKKLSGRTHLSIHPTTYIYSLSTNIYYKSIYFVIYTFITFLPFQFIPLFDFDKSLISYIFFKNPSIIFIIRVCVCLSRTSFWEKYS